MADATNTTNPSELLPCPFCGLPGSLFATSDHSTAWEGGCPDEACPAHDCLWFVSEAGAIAALNRRAIVPMPDRVRELENALRMWLTPSHEPFNVNAAIAEAERLLFGSDRAALADGDA
jgi:hypothetical protein